MGVFGRRTCFTRMSISSLLAASAMMVVSLARMVTFRAVPSCSRVAASACICVICWFGDRTESISFGCA